MATSNSSRLALLVGGTTALPATTALRFAVTLHDASCALDLGTKRAPAPTLSSRGAPELQPLLSGDALSPTLRPRPQAG